MTHQDLDTHDQEPDAAPPFTPSEARVLACLMEKELVTPDNYPLTLNSLTLACNQKSNREPVMNLSSGEVGHLANELVKRELVRMDHGERAPRVSHRMHRSYASNRPQQAVLTVLMLRRPQTLNEIRTRTERMAEFDDSEGLLGVLEDLMRRQPPLAVCLPKGPGRREDRYTHTLCGPVEMETAHATPTLPDVESQHPTRIESLEERVDELEKQLADLLNRLQANDRD